MLSKPLLKKTIKNNYKLWIGITAGLTLMLIIILAAQNSFSGGDEVENDISYHIMNQFYGMFAMLLPMIYVVITGNKLIAAQVDKGSFAYVMSKPVKRNQVSMTQAFFFIGSIFAMFAVVAVTGLIMIAATGVNQEIDAFLLLNLGIICYHLAISGISFMASCIFNRSSTSLLVGAGIPVAFFMFNILASLSDLADIMKLFKYLTINTLFSVSDIMANSTNMIWQFLILFGIAAVCYTVGVMYFKKKDLSL